MRKALVLLTLCAVFTGHLAHGEMRKESYTLSEAVQYALRNNPRLAALHKDIEIENYTIDEAKGDRLPRVNLISTATRARYDLPVSPISGSPFEGGFPEFDNPIYDIGVSFNLPIYMGGRLSRQVKIAEISKSIAEDGLTFDRQELVFNVTSIYYKILELENVLEANEKRVSQLEAHKKDVELFLEAGNVPRVDLLNTETGLAHARHNALIVKHNLESAYELLKNFMGIEDVDAEISVVPEIMNRTYPDIQESREKAFSLRPDYKAVLKKQKIADERVDLMAGKRLPSVNLYGEYTENSGNDFDFKDNWLISLKLTVPIFDGGVIKTQVQRERKKLEKIKEEERALRLEILRQIKDAHLGIDNAQKRIEVLSKGIETAEEILRIERLKYEAGAGTSTDVIDAQTALLRAGVEYYQGIYDKDIAVAALEKAIGKDIYKEVSE
ncbi:MAG TPA: TolC family protein [Nitrospirae bacterium]|nr:outer membrane efflux protein BepC precursor [bacterium BMS3Abin06]HDH12545.1 TolC family protein [Nitrospirota bacterium]HDZ00704.1 TolC family protein [Nitrospirota bacterium]